MLDWAKSAERKFICSIVISNKVAEKISKIKNCILLFVMFTVFWRDVPLLTILLSLGLTSPGLRWAESWLVLLTHQTQRTADVSRQELRITMLLPTLSLSGGGETRTNHLNNNLKYLLNLQGRSASLSWALISPSYHLMINLNLLSQDGFVVYFTASKSEYFILLNKLGTVELNRIKT